MFWGLFKKECKMTWKSLIFWLYIAAVTLFFFSQMGTIQFEPKPLPGEEEGYGSKISNKKEDQMKGTLGLLAESYMEDQFTTAPVGFTKKVNLNHQEKKEIGNILEETTGLSLSEIRTRYGKWMNNHSTELEDGSRILWDGQFLIDPESDLTYRMFLRKMKQVCDILGPGSDYTKEQIKNNAIVERTYEDALADYQHLIRDDRLTGGYARLFCDYMGIILGILPAFAAVTRSLRDQRAKMTELIYIRRASSFTIILSRYMALCISFMIPVLLLSCFPLAACIEFAEGTEIHPDMTAFAVYSLGWLLPTVMVVTALGMIMTELTGSAAGVIVQAVWWFLSVFSGADSMEGGAYGMNLIPRHNTEFNYEGFHNQFSQLLVNRIFYVVLALALLTAAALIFEARRKGRFGNGTIFMRRKNIRALSSAETGSN